MTERIYSVSAKTLYSRAAWVIEFLQGKGVVAVAGAGINAHLLVAAIAVLSSKAEPLAALIVREKVKDHGTETLIEGPLPPAGSWVAAISAVAEEDTEWYTITALETAGYRVLRVKARDGE